MAEPVWQHRGPVTAERVKLLGKQVRVTLDEQYVIQGRLLAFCEDGEFVIEDSAGMVSYGWPALSIKEADDPSQAVHRK